MKTIYKAALKGMLVMLVLAGLTTSGMAQYGASQATIRNLVQRIQNRTDSLQRVVQNDRGAYRAADLNRLIFDFESAVNQLDRQLTSRRNSTSDARLVLDRAVLIDTFVVDNRVSSGTLREWQSLRADLNQLAGYYNLSPNWGSGGSSNDDYNLSDSQMRQLVQSLDRRSTTFSRFLRRDLNRARYSDRDIADQVRQQLSEYEISLIQLRNRVNSRQSSSSDARNLLDRAAFLNNYVVDRQLSPQTENNWNLLRSDLDRLAGAFSIAWNWTDIPGRNNGQRGDLTGTFRLDTSRGDNPRNAVDAATRNMSQAERQRVYDALLRRLDAPQMLAIDRRGTAVTIASSRAPQINFTANGRDQVETMPNGSRITVRASFSGDALTISRTGERANDFTVIFDPVDNGRQLLVTRTIYTDRLNQAVTVRNYYDRTSDVAQLDIYDTNREDSTGEEVSGNFVVPNGTQVVAVLNDDLSTQNVSEGQRFTLTVRSPGQYEGATIEGHVINVDRSGRITGRSELTMDFDTIRLRNGRTYNFAGIIETVRTTEGDVVKVDNEGAVRESSQTEKTVTRTAIGTAVGAIIGAIAGGGKGAAIGAVIGAGAGAGSVYVQGRDDLKLDAGTEVTIRATGPNR